MTDAKKTILITGVGGDIGQNIIRCIKDSDYGLKIIGCDIDLYAAGQALTDDFIVSPRANQVSEYLKFIADMNKRRKIDYILPSTEAEIELLNMNRNHFDKENIELIINNPMIINTFLDKYETIRFFDTNNIPHPETYLIGDYNGQLDFPVIIKSKKSWGGKGIYGANDADELEFYRKRMENPIIQEPIGSEDEEYTVGVFSDGSQIFSIAFQRTLGYGSMTKIARKINDSKISELMIKIAKACDLKGSINVQLRKTGQDYIPFEINPRISSTVFFRHHFGFQDVKWWLDIKNNKEISYIEKYQNGVGVRNIGEIFFELE